MSALFLRFIRKYLIFITLEKYSSLHIYTGKGLCLDSYHVIKFSGILITSNLECTYYFLDISFEGLLCIFSSICCSGFLHNQCLQFTSVILHHKIWSFMLLHFSALSSFLLYNHILHLSSKSSCCDLFFFYFNTFN